ncbi:transmembrane protein 26-like [Babylonia areolata]|uniref:transmembrane protein 26-like n=1 Tax=Babylonia areolata TaxID=304850 RepID=UPI003FD2B51D
MSWVSVARAVLVRLLFAVHGLISIWLLATVTREARYWYMASGMGLLLLEMTVTLGKKGGKEWKWFCPSVFIYLMCVVPAIWFLELHEMEKRIERRRQATANVTLPAHGATRSRDLQNETEEELTAKLGTVMGVHLEFRIPLKLKSEEWIKATEQLLLLLLILGRWLMPKGKLTHDQLSQLLLVYIGTAADIVEFFDAFKEDVVKYEPLLCMAVLGIWSLSLIQFSLVLTAARARRDQTGLVPGRRPRRTEKKGAGCCSPDVYGIIISILLQDAPFLVLRMLLIFKYDVLSYTNMFFTSKNTIVIVLLIYRLVVVHLEKRREEEEDDVEAELLKDRGWRLAKSSSFSPGTYTGKSRLVQSGSSHSNGFYVPSHSTTPCREDGSVGSIGSISRVGGVRTLGGGAMYNRVCSLDHLSSPL